MKQYKQKYKLEELKANVETLIFQYMGDREEIINMYEVLEFIKGRIQYFDRNLFIKLIKQSELFKVIEGNFLALERWKPAEEDEIREWLEHLRTRRYNSPAQIFKEIKEDFIKKEQYVTDEQVEYILEEDDFALLEGSGYCLFEKISDVIESVFESLEYGGTVKELQRQVNTKIAQFNMKITDEPIYEWFSRNYERVYWVDKRAICKEKMKGIKAKIREVVESLNSHKMRKVQNLVHSGNGSLKSK